MKCISVAFTHNQVASAATSFRVELHLCSLLNYMNKPETVSTRLKSNDFWLLQY